MTAHVSHTCGQPALFEVLVVTNQEMVSCSSNSNYLMQLLETRIMNHGKRTYVQVHFPLLYLLSPTTILLHKLQFEIGVSFVLHISFPSYHTLVIGQVLKIGCTCVGIVWECSRRLLWRGVRGGLEMLWDCQQRGCHLPPIWGNAMSLRRSVRSCGESTRVRMGFATLPMRMSH